MLKKRSSVAFEKDYGSRIYLCNKVKEKSINDFILYLKGHKRSK